MESKTREVLVKSYAGFGIIFYIDEERKVNILIVMEDPKSKKGGSHWENFFFKFPGGNLDIEKRGDTPKDLFFLSNFKIMTEVCGLSFENLSKKPFFTLKKGKHLVNFYLAKFDEGVPYPCKNLKLTEFVPEKIVLMLLKKNRFLSSHRLALEEFFRCLNLIRLGNPNIPEHALSLKKYWDDVVVK